MAKIVLFNKPYQVISQFSEAGEKKTLADFIDIKNVYPAGRLDYDSEGLLLLTGDGRLQARITSPKHKTYKTYWAEVEGDINRSAVVSLQRGVELKDGMTLPARVRRIEIPEALWPRNPPVRFRKNIPTSWVEIRICEGRNRQVRRMCAAVGFPVLRLIRSAIGEWSLDGLAPGELKCLDK